MRNFLKSSPRWLQAGWVLPLVLLTLPNCILNGGPYEGSDDPLPLVFDPGVDPLSGAIMCDIPKVPDPEASECAKDDEIESGFRMSYAAIALAQNEPGNSLGLDWSKAATDACEGKPKKVEFHASFPEGLQICLNCSQIGSKYVDPAAACVAKCIDLVNLDGKAPPPGGAESWCAEKAKVSTNWKDLCFEGACSDGGTSVAFDDPRRYQVPVNWTDFGGQAEVSGKDLIKNGGVAGNVDSGASSDALITRGDAWIEFAANETDKTHVVSVATDAGPDTDYTLADIGYSISLNADGFVYVVEDGANFVSAALGSYEIGQRFRVKIRDNGDGTAKISYVKIKGECKDAMICTEEQMDEQHGPSPSYPLRIKAMFREPDATLLNVTVVSIQEPK
jgi:hypothetical protein